MLKFHNDTTWVNVTCSCPLCGSSNGKTLSSPPGAGTLCAIGAASTISGGGPWTWTCTSSDGKTVASCTALLNIAGSCGTGAGNYPNTATGFSGPLCASGTISPSSVSFPSPGGSVSWSCLGSSGTGPACSASVAVPPCYHTSCPTGTMASAPYPITSSSGRVQCMFCGSCPSSNWCSTGSGGRYIPCDATMGPGSGTMTWCY